MVRIVGRWAYVWFKLKLYIFINDTSHLLYSNTILLLQEQEMEKQKLLFHQTRLSSRGVAEMVLLHISASKGVSSEMVMKTLELGIAILRGGNIEIQMVCYIIHRSRMI